MEDERFLELASEFVLSGLEGEELEEFEAELERRGAEGRRRVRLLREAAASLAWSAPPVDPPESLRDRVLAAAGPGDAEMAGSPDEAGPADGPPGPADPSRSSGARDGSGRTGRRWRVAAGLAAAAVLALAVWNWELRDDLREVRSRMDSLRTTLASADSAAEALDDLRRDLLTVASPQASVLDLAGTDRRPGARARVFVDPATGRALLFAYELPILPPDSVYQLWSIRDGEPQSAGTFTSRDEGPARLELDSLETVVGADALAVTVEPAPGQPSPTGPMVLQTSL